MAGFDFCTRERERERFEKFVIARKGEARLCN